MNARFFPGQDAGDPRIFRYGARGTHSSRTAMFAELKTLLEARSTADPRVLVVDENLLAKPTAAGRAIAFQRLRELYLLDTRQPAFRLLRALWRLDTGALPQLALLLALARDPLLRLSAPPILSLRPGEQVSRVALVSAIQAGSGARLNEAVADKVARNAASTWTQAGLLEGRTFKLRRTLEAPLTAALFGMWLAKKAGFGGAGLLDNAWMASLDLSANSARGLAERGRAAGHLSLRTAADLVDIDLTPLDLLR